MQDKYTSLSSVSVYAAVRRGLAKRCPRCGVGAVLKGYITPAPKCGTCHLNLSRIRADDGPAWATLIVVGHLLAPLMVALGRDDRIPIWLAIVLCSAVVLVCVWWCLPRAKGLFIALIWSLDATGDEMDPSQDQNR